MTREERNVLLFVVAGVVAGSVPWPRAMHGPGTSLAEAPERAPARSTAAAPAAPSSDSLALAAAVRPVDRPDAGGTPEPVDLFPIDLNRASAELIEELPGIGPAKAEAIVALRERLGSFRSVEQLDEVRGIGPRTVERLRGLVTVGKDDGGRDRGRSPLGERQTGSPAPGERNPLGGATGSGP